jgi:hypothetical protein
MVRLAAFGYGDGCVATFFFMIFYLLEVDLSCGLLVYLLGWVWSLPCVPR